MVTFRNIHKSPYAIRYNSNIVVNSTVTKTRGTQELIV